MKRYVCKATVLFVLTIFASSMLFAQGTRAVAKFPEFHYLTLSMGGGYANLLTNVKDMPDTKLNGGGGATLGLGYEYCYRGFWLSLGVEGQYIASFMNPGFEVSDVPAIDTEGDNCTFHFQTNQWRDQTQAVYLNIPFMLGFNKGGFYAGIGAKAGLGLYAIGQSRLKYTTTSTYDWAIGDFEQMPNHFIGDFVSTAEGGKYTKLKMNPNIAAIIEIGYEVYSDEGGGSVLPWRMKVGLYGEYGFMNVNGSAQNGIAPYRHDENVTQLITPASLSTENFVGKSVNPLYIGAKLTFMFELPVPQKCNCLQDSRGASWRNNAPKVTRKQDKKIKQKREKERKDKRNKTE
ncbi:MAG: hypothetical protein ACI3Z7_03335 [Candidatus Aphodosoma sp.]